MEINKLELGDRIRNVRNKRLESMEKFGQAIADATNNQSKSGKSNVSRWERGENIPNNETLKAISDLGGITVDELLYGSIEERIYKAIHSSEYNKGLSLRVIDSIASDLIDYVNRAYPNKDIPNEDIEALVKAEMMLKLPKWEQMHLSSDRYQVNPDRYQLRTQEIKETLTQIVNNPLQEDAFSQLMNALNETYFIEFGYADMLSIYSHNTVNENKINDIHSLLTYLNQRYETIDQFLKESGDDHSEMAMDLSIELSFLAKNISEIENYLKDNA